MLQFGALDNSKFSQMQGMVHFTNSRNCHKVWTEYIWLGSRGFAQMWYLQ